jgi:hypothetical protein
VNPLPSEPEFVPDELAVTLKPGHESKRISDLAYPMTGLTLGGHTFQVRAVNIWSRNPHPWSAPDHLRALDCYAG